MKALGQLWLTVNSQETHGGFILCHCKDEKLWVFSSRLLAVAFWNVPSSDLTGVNKNTGRGRDRVLSCKVASWSRPPALSEGRASLIPILPRLPQACELLRREHSSSLTTQKCLSISTSTNLKCYKGKSKISAMTSHFFWNMKFHVLIFDTKGMFCLWLCNFMPIWNFLNAKYSLPCPNIPSLTRVAQCPCPVKDSSPVCVASCHRNFSKAPDHLPNLSARDLPRYSYFLPLL